MDKGLLSLKKRSRWIVIIFLIGFLAVIIKLVVVQFVQGEELTNLANEQISSARRINPKRGTIFDSTEKNILAISSTVYTVTVNPVNIFPEDKQKVANILSQIFDLDYDKVLKKLNKNTSIENIVKKIDKEDADKLRLWMKENNILKGINIDEDTKRYYPLGKFASQIIGFCGSDNQGLGGIEAKYDEILKGQKRKNRKTNRCKRKYIRTGWRKICRSYRW